MRVQGSNGGSISKVGGPKINDQIFSPTTRVGSGVARNFKRGKQSFHILFSFFFSAKLI